MAKPKLREIVQCNDNEWITIEWTDQHEECCHCGLVHSVDYRVQDGKLQFRARQIGRRS